MKNTTEAKVIMYESPEAAQPYTLAGWIDVNRMFHQREEQARFASHTHSLCECGNITRRGLSKCEDCGQKIQNERYLAMPFKEWDRETCVTIFLGDERDYFFGEDSLLEICADRKIDPESLQLIICEQQGFYHVQEDYWEDVLPEDGDIPEALSKKLQELNELIDTLPTASWVEGKFRTSYRPKS